MTKTERIAHVVDLYGRGYGGPDIARHLDLNPASVRRYLRDAGVVIRKERGTARGLPLLGPSPSEIAEAKHRETTAGYELDREFQWPDGHPADHGRRWVDDRVEEVSAALGVWFGVRNGTRPAEDPWPEVAEWHLYLDLCQGMTIWSAVVEELPGRFRWTAEWGDTLLDRGFSSTLRGARKKAEGVLRDALSDNVDEKPGLRRDMQAALAVLTGEPPLGPRI